MRIKRRLSAAEFQTIRPLLKISDDRIEAARLALVEGKTLQSIGDMFEWSRQAVNDAVNVVWRTLETYHESQRVATSSGTLLPPGWEQVTLIAPSYLITKFREEIAAALPLPNKDVSTNKKAQ